MHIKRSAHSRFYTKIANDVLRDSRMSYTARGIIAALLSLPDGQPIDIRTLAERTTDGRERVASAIRELERFGYLRRTVKRARGGRLYTEFVVFETPLDASTRAAQVAPDAGFPGSGGAEPGPHGDHPVEEREEETNHPAPPPGDTPADTTPASETGRRADTDLSQKTTASPAPAEPEPSPTTEHEEDADLDEATAASAALLARVARAEPKLSLGRCEALRLAPLVTEWRRRGATDLHLIGALATGLPRDGIHHPARFLDFRLTSKMPTAHTPAPTRPECETCRAPLTTAGVCRTCRQTEPAPTRASAEARQVRARGVALARAALRGLTPDCDLGIAGT
jgi:helix-turn-helix protein